MLRYLGENSGKSKSPVVLAHNKALHDGSQGPGLMLWLLVLRVRTPSCAMHGSRTVIAAGKSMVYELPDALNTIMETDDQEHAQSDQTWHGCFAGFLSGASFAVSSIVWVMMGGVR